MFEEARQSADPACVRVDAMWCYDRSAVEVVHAGVAATVAARVPVTKKNASDGRRASSGRIGWRMIWPRVLEKRRTVV